MNRIALVGLVLWLTACAGPERGREPADPRIIRDGRLLMGTVLELSLVSSDPVAARRLLTSGFEQVSSLEALVSRHRRDSQLSELIHSAGGGARRVDPRLVGLIERGLALSRSSGGAFDISVGPVVDLWMRAAQRGWLPHESELAEARSLVGDGAIAVSSDGSVALAKPGASLDLGAIAKGYALDELAASLRASGCDAALLSFGGSSVVALGHPPDATSWRLLLGGAFGEPARTFSLRDLALSVSSTGSQTVEIEGRHFSHIVDPRSGQALLRERRSVVLARSATTADAVSTALLVMSADEGVAWVEDMQGVEAQITTREEDGTLGVRSSRGWPGWEAAPPPG